MTEQEKAPPDTRHIRLGTWIQKHLTAILVLCVSAVGTGIAGQITGTTERLMARLTERGDPISVDLVEVHENGWSMAFASDVQFSDAEAYELGLGEDSTQNKLSSMGAANIGSVSIRVVVSGKRLDGAYVTGMAVDKECTAPYTGPYFEIPGGSGMPSIPMVFDLDGPQPQGMDSQGPDAKPYFMSNAVQVKKEERQFFEITAHAEEYACSFAFGMSILDGDKTSVMRIDNNGKPFRVTPQMDNTVWTQAFMGGFGCDAPRPGFTPLADGWREGTGTGNPCRQ